MLYIGIKRFNDTNQIEKTYSWHVGEIKDWMRIEENRVVMIQADGDELQFLMELIVNLPMHRAMSVQKWNGDLAQWIFTQMKRGQ